MVLKNASILIVDDDDDVLVAMRLLLKSKSKEVVTERNPNNLLARLAEKKFDVIILDMNFKSMINTGNEGIFWLNKIREKDDKVAVIMITAYGDIDLAIKALKEGASDFVVKPWQNDKLIETISDLLDQKKAKKRSTNKASKIIGTTLLGESEAMQDVFYKIKKVAPTDANILILGENGTGKDLIAQAIHYESKRKESPYVKVDIGALTSTLFESELFGHKKGAFTDARQDRQGRFEVANKGTLFLDEIGNIGLPQQAKLLSVLQNRRVTPLGANAPLDVDIRLICATNMELSELADEANFRKDLIYRINTVEIIVPPLRKRKKDIPLLADHFIKIYSEKYSKTDLQYDNGFLNKLTNYKYPGNVRELQYALERAVIMAEDQTLKAEDLIFSPIESRVFRDDEVEDFKLESVEKRTILKVIEKNSGNISRAAKELGITRAALYRRLNKYDL